MFYALAGSWEAVWEGASYPVTLPGTLDENNIGYTDSGEDYTYIYSHRRALHPQAHLRGPVTFRRVVDWQPPQGRPGCSSRWAVPATCVCW